LVIRTKAMRHRRDFPAALLLLTLGCAGKIAPVDAGGPWETSDSATCALYTCAVDCDAADPCVPTPADVACNSNADCTWFVVEQCSCFSLTYGVNTGAFDRISRACPGPPCAVSSLNPPCVDAGTGVYTQDCQSAPLYPWRAAALCVDHQCRTYVPAIGSE
jgi:hypothetical protein